MKKLHFDYHMQIVYTEQVEKCHFTIKCLPAATDRQQPEEIKIKLEPEVSFGRGEDSFGNKILYGCVDHSHKQFIFHVTGNVRTGLSDCETVKKEGRIGMYKYPSGLTEPGEGLRAYYRSLEGNIKGSSREAGIYLMERLYQDFVYEKNVTDVNTTAEEAWQHGSGVCQDYAHILIALCRMAGIPARYVAGMLIGEGFSHAWTEILADGRWYALDPTNNLLVTDSHIKLGVGRDAADCAINRGVVVGGGAQTQTIHVSVQEAEEG